MARVKYQFLVWAYVIMPRHVHLIIKPVEENYSISKMLQSIKQPVAQRYNMMKQGNPLIKAFWQSGGGYDRNITDFDTLVSAIKYIHNNPVRKALVDNPDEVRVNETEGESIVILEINVSAEDVGKIIGREGRIANAIRTVVKAAAAKQKKKVTVEIITK
jgi:predicted RNA-binding protein YlqC (UPF0109 family)